MTDVDDAPLLIDLQRRFYKAYITTRYEAVFGIHGKKTIEGMAK